MLRMENVRCWRIVDDDGISEVTANLRKILGITAKSKLIVYERGSARGIYFNIVSLMIITAVSK